MSDRGSPKEFFVQLKLEICYSKNYVTAIFRIKYSFKLTEHIEIN